MLEGVYDGIPSSRLPRKMAEAVEHADDDAVNFLLSIAERRGFSDFIDAFHALQRALEPTPSVTWMEDAQQIFSSYSPVSEGDFLVYAVLLAGKRQGDFGLYVGQTGDHLFERFIEHKTGGECLSRMNLKPTSQKHVHRRGTHLLLNLTKHLQGISCCEAIEIEQRLIRHIRRSFGAQFDVVGYEQTPVCKRHSPFKPIPLGPH